MARFTRPRPAPAAAIAQTIAATISVSGSMLRPISTARGSSA
ncbi:MAG: hypothetical protein BWZ08_02067 [candidate division BRC1 bacterium ADurb.BinA292]|nr:MAG: hypothetical protein BWZ08_02067 [candidate division BRC1 bacterium ADurb.BinA292]